MTSPLIAPIIILMITTAASLGTILTMLRTSRLVQPCTGIIRRILSTSIIDEHRRKASTQKWLDSIVIGEKLCPFAPPLSKEPKLRIHVSNASNHDDIVYEIANEARLLLNRDDYNEDDDLSGDSSSGRSRPETTLVVLNENRCPSIKEFRDLVSLSWRVQDESILQNGFEKDLQIVLFHPQAVHDTYSSLQESNDDAANYTIRSPFPTIHLLREIDVLNAVKSGYKDLEGLPSRNKSKLRSLGLKVCQQKLSDCFL